MFQSPPNHEEINRLHDRLLNALSLAIENTENPKVYKSRWRSRKNRTIMDVCEYILGGSDDIPDASDE